MGMLMPYIPLINTGNTECERLLQEASYPNWSTIYIVVDNDEFPKDNKAINLFIAGTARFDITVSKKNAGKLKNYRILVCDNAPFDTPARKPGADAIKDWMKHTNNYQIVFKFTDAQRTVKSIQSFEGSPQMRVLFHNEHGIYFIDENHKRQYIW